MVVGFNHNFRYRDEVFHVQTEDGGRDRPHIITLLYQGGSILGSQKSSYADITATDNLEQVVEERMKEQHREMLRRLKAGEFDELIAGNRQAPAPAPPEPVAVNPPVPAAEGQPGTEAAAPPEAASAGAGLDEIILAYLEGDRQKGSRR